MSLRLRDAIVTKLKSRFDGVVIDTHEGDVGAATFKRWVMQSPGIYIVCTGSSTVGDLGRLPMPPWRFAAFVVTRNTPGCADPPSTTATEGDRDRVAHALAVQLLGIIHTEGWGVGAQQASGLRADNKSTPQLAQQAGANLWVVTWEQALALSPEELAAAESYVRNPRPLEGVDTRIHAPTPPPDGRDPLATDEVSFP